MNTEKLSNEAENPALNKGAVIGSFKVGDTVYYHIQDVVRERAFVAGIEDNGYGLWIRFARLFKGKVIDKFVSCYDVSKNYRLTHRGLMSGCPLKEKNCQTKNK